MYEDKKRELLQRINNSRLMQNYRDNQEKSQHPFVNAGKAIYNGYKAINGINKAKSLINGFQQPSQPGQIGNAINTNIGGQLGNNPMMNGAQSQLGGAISSQAPSAVSNVGGLTEGASALGNTANTASTASNAAQGASTAAQGASTASSAASAAPVAGAALGGLSSGMNFAKGDYKNGAMDAAATGAMFIPGVGWAVAGAIKVAQMLMNAMEKKKQKAMQKAQAQGEKALQDTQQAQAQKDAEFDEAIAQNRQNMQQQLQANGAEMPSMVNQQPQQDNSQLKQEISNQVFGNQQQGVGDGTFKANMPFGEQLNNLTDKLPFDTSALGQSTTSYVNGLTDKYLGTDLEGTVGNITPDAIAMDMSPINRRDSKGEVVQPFYAKEEEESIIPETPNKISGGTTGQAAGVLGQLPNLNKQGTMPTNYAEENAPALGYEGSAQQGLDEAQAKESTKRSLMDKFRSGLQDFGAGYQDNANSTLSTGDLAKNFQGQPTSEATSEPIKTEDGAYIAKADSTKKSLMNRLGELAGTGQRIAAHPLTQAAIAGGISKLAGGDIDDIAKAAYQYGTQKAAADRYYQETTGKTNRPFLNTYGIDDYKTKVAQDQWNRNYQQKQNEFDWKQNKDVRDYNYKVNKDALDRDLKKEEIAARKEYYRTRGKRDSANSAAQQKFEYTQSLNKSLGQFSKYAEDLARAKEKEGMFASSKDKAAIAKAQENYDKARDFMLNTYGGDFIKYAKEQGWE